MTSAALSRTALTAVLALAVLLAGAAQGQPPAGTKQADPKKETKPGSGPAKPGPAKPAPKAAEPEQIKTFELQNANPEDVRQTLTGVWGELMNLRGLGGKGKAPRLSADPRSRTLFVRGTEQEVEVVGELVAILDAAPGKAPPESKGMQVIRLKHAKVPEVVKVLSELGLQGRVVQLSKLNTLILAADGPDVREVQTVIEKLERAPGETAKKPDKKVAEKPMPPKR